MRVVKLGGSLSASERLEDWLRALRRAGGGQVVVVPGGGPFADAVRQAQARWRFADAGAHRMAQLAMAQYGLMLAALEPALTPVADLQACAPALARGSVPVWIPTESAPGDDELPQTWDVTSDSLAAWLARRLGATHLALVKSAPLELGALRVEALACGGVVDAYFARAIDAAPFATWLYTAGEAALFERWLAGEPTGRRVTPGAESAAHARG